jgi:hypothetical protein
MRKKDIRGWRLFQVYIFVLVPLLMVSSFLSNSEEWLLRLPGPVFGFAIAVIMYLGCKPVFDVVGEDDNSGKPDTNQSSDCHPDNR